jgi:hypothetical protein
MKEVPDNTGRFAMRPHYDHRELDRTFERRLADFFRISHGTIPTPISTDDLTRLIEQDTSDFDPGADLSCYGEGVEGVTEFQTVGKPRVRIASELAYDEARENRYRTTLTHEYGHVHLHNYLFQMSNAPSERTQVCKRDTITGASANDWIEWQAGYACGALLMPASLVRKRVESLRASYGLTDSTSIRGQMALELIDTVKVDFRVSDAAARVRLKVMGFLRA